MKNYITNPIVLLFSKAALHEQQYRVIGYLSRQYTEDTRHSRVSKQNCGHVNNVLT